MCFQSTCEVVVFSWYLHINFIKKIGVHVVKNLSFAEVFWKGEHGELVRSLLTMVTQGIFWPSNLKMLFICLGDESRLYQERRTETSRVLSFQKDGLSCQTLYSVYFLHRSMFASSMVQLCERLSKEEDPKEQRQGLPHIFSTWLWKMQLSLGRRECQGAEQL